MHEFLFWLFLAGLIIASYTDIKRREVDNWLTLLLIFASWGFVFLLFKKDIIVFAMLSFIILFFIMNLLYYGRIFGGGDAQLLFAMFAVFIGVSAWETLWNVGFFVILALITGSLWGIFYSGVLFIKNFKKSKAEFKKQWSKGFNYMILAGICFFVLSYVEILFLAPAIIFFIFPVLIVFAKAVDKCCMIKELNGKELREGDWLLHDETTRGGGVRADWEGLQEKDLKLLRKKKKVIIKDGVPFVPGFLIAFFIYYFLRDAVFGLI